MSQKISPVVARSFLALVGVISLAVGAVDFVGYGVAANSTAGSVFAVVGLLGLVLTAVFGTTDVGLSNTQQSYLSGISAALIALGSISATAHTIISANPTVGLTLAVLGAIGFAIKEAAGSA